MPSGELDDKQPAPVVYPTLSREAGFTRVDFADEKLRYRHAKSAFTRSQCCAQMLPQLDTPSNTSRKPVELLIVSVRRIVNDWLPEDLHYNANVFKILKTF